MCSKVSCHRSYSPRARNSGLSSRAQRTPVPHMALVRINLIADIPLLSCSHENTTKRLWIKIGVDTVCIKCGALAPISFGFIVTGHRFLLPQILAVCVHEDLMSAPTIQVHQGIATITFNRPKSLNAITREDYDFFASALREIDKRDDVLITVWQGNAP